MAITLKESEAKGVLGVFNEKGVGGARPEGKPIEELALAIEDFSYIVVMDYQGESLVGMDNTMVGFPKKHPPYLGRADGAKWVRD